MLTPGQQLLRDALLYIKHEGPIIQGCGICGNVEDAVIGERVPIPEDMNPGSAADEAESALHHAFANLGLSTTYPVKGGGYTYDDASNKGYMWDRDHPYGAARWALLDQLLDYLREQS